MKKNQNISKDTLTTYNVVRKERRDFGLISPVTKVISNKKKNPRTKHKGKQFDFD